MMSTLDHSTDGAHARARIRRDVRRARRALTPRERSIRSHTLCRRLLGSGLLRRYRRFSAFFANDGEADLSEFARRARAAGKQIFMPVIHGPRLWFLATGEDTPLVNNRFGIPEPVGRADQRLRPIALDVVLMPLVAFDRRGHRIGMGGGYYDRTFAFKRLRRAAVRPLLVGVGFDFQCVQTLTPQPWDVGLDAAVTDREILWFGGDASRSIDHHSPSREDH